MAERPIFVPDQAARNFVSAETVTFDWYPGFSVQQKQRSIAALHAQARNRHICENPLEISSKSPEKIGVELSAFNLQLRSNGFKAASVEVFFQGSKKFERGGPYNDLYQEQPRAAKKDPRLRESGALRSFVFRGQEWDLEPTTSFYDWLYISALLSNETLAEEVSRFDGFTDIEFNPKKSFNCQARSLALFVALRNRENLEELIADKDLFINRCYEQNRRGESQQTLFD